MNLGQGEAALAGRVREHHRRNQASEEDNQRASVVTSPDQHGLGLTEERLLPSNPRGVLTRTVADRRRIGVALPWFREERSVRAGPQGQTVEVAGFAGESEIARVGHVTVDNAVLDSPNKAHHTRQRGALEGSKLVRWRQPLATWCADTCGVARHHV